MESQQKFEMAQKKGKILHSIVLEKFRKYFENFEFLPEFKIFWKILENLEVWTLKKLYNDKRLEKIDDFWRSITYLKKSTFRATLRELKL